MNLTPVSREYYQCFQKHATKPFPLVLSKSSQKLLKKIYSGIHVRRPSAITSESDEPVLSKIREDPWFSNIPQEVQREIAAMKYTKTYHMKIGDRNISVVLVQHSNSRDFCKQAIDKIERWLSFVLSVCPAKCANTLDIYLCLTDHKKMLPAKVGALYDGGSKTSQTLVDQIHANTAFTTSCSHTNSIFIYRKEEWFKVLIHESFHCLGLDFSKVGSSGEPDRIIKSTFPALSDSVDIRLYETYCEMWAEIINLMFLCGPSTMRCKSVKYSTSRTRTRKSVSKTSGFNCMMRLLKYERMYSVFQANKLLRHYGLKYTDLTHKTKMYNENTPAFSYYVLKSILMWNVDKFLKWCLDNNPTPYSLEFEKTNVVAYATLVQHNCNDGSYLDATEKIGEFGVEKCGKTIASSMRMCLFEGV